MTRDSPAPDPDPDVEATPLALPAAALEAIAQVTVELGEILDVGRLAYGRRRMIPIVGGRVDGPELSGEILDGGEDWQLVWEDGTAEIDTRYAVRTTDGSLLTLQTRGFRHGPPEVLAALAAGKTVPADQYTFRVSARIETAAPAHAWVNRTLFVAVAARYAHAVVYDLYALR